MSKIKYTRESKNTLMKKATNKSASKAYILYIMCSEPELYIYVFTKEINALIVVSQDSGSPLDHCTAGDY